MRDYGAQEIETHDFTLGGKKKYSIPLASSLPMKYARKFARLAHMDEADASSEAVEVEMEILADYLGEDVANKLTAKQVGEIFSDWNRLNEGLGAEQGE